MSDSGRTSPQSSARSASQTPNSTRSLSAQTSSRSVNNQTGTARSGYESNRDSITASGSAGPDSGRDRIDESNYDRSYTSSVYHEEESRIDTHRSQGGDSIKGTVNESTTHLDSGTEDYYHVVGAALFVMGIVAAIIMIFLLIFYKPHRDVVFGVLFGVFLIFLALCLFFTYYLGYVSLPLVDEETITDRFWTMPNILILVSLVVEFLQMASFAFHPSLRWGGTRSLRFLNFIAAPFGTSHTSFQVLYWIMFGFAFSPYLYVVAIRAVIWYRIVSDGPDSSERFVDKYQQRIYSSLLCLVSVLYFPVLSLLCAGLDCDYKHYKPTIQLEYDPLIRCFKGKQIAMLICSLLAIVAYYPASSFAQAQAQAITDIKFHPRFIFLQLQSKFILVVLATFLRIRSFWGYMATVLTINLIFLISSYYSASCSVKWVRRMRMVFFYIASWAAISAMICRKVDSDWIPLVVLCVGSLVWTVLCFAGFWIWDNILREQEWAKSLFA